MEPPTGGWIIYIELCSPLGTKMLFFIMVNNLLAATLVLFIVGLLLSTAVTQRDCMAIKRIEGNMRWRQRMLVCLDAVQIGFFIFGIASIIQNRPDRVEPAITWALQCMACTNVRSSIAHFSRTDNQVYTASPGYLIGCLVAVCTFCGTGAIHRAQRRDVT